LKQAFFETSLGFEVSVGFEVSLVLTKGASASGARPFFFASFVWRVFFTRTGTHPASSAGQAFARKRSKSN
jgi:hypothetical protein